LEFFSPIMVRVALFLLFSAVLAGISWPALHNPRSHGFYRFLVFESILALVLLNLPFWFQNPYAPRQLLSWALLFTSIFLVLDGVYLLKKLGGHRHRRESPENFSFENTARLVSEGIYRYVRHPMYTSLLFLAWGAALKHLAPVALAGALLSTVLLVITAKVEERESLTFFGATYSSYVHRTKMFIPFLF
jgi:protein-S-isoprenylcysteine O-methyltransferase Ste14